MRDPLNVFDPHNVRNGVFPWFEPRQLLLVVQALVFLVEVAPILDSTLLGIITATANLACRREESWFGWYTKTACLYLKPIEN